MKIELKHLAPYLPYGLKVKIESKLYPTPMIIGYLRGVIYCNYHGVSCSFNIEQVKPILRPLSDLTKEIEVNGEKFVPILYLIEVHGNSLDYSYLLSTKNVIEYSYAIVEKLLEWHFDIFGLIENNLAIDINTLNK
jgi:hypothetical protein